MKIVVHILTLLTIVGCSESTTYKFEPINNVGVNLFVGKAEISKEGNTYIKFKYKIKNESKSKIRLNTNKINISVNGKKPVFVHYNSLASTPEANFVLKSGETEHELYLMLENILKNGKIEEFKVNNFGIELADFPHS